MKVEKATILLKTLADESRLTIINLLIKNKRMYGAEFLPFLKCKQATLSHHMKELTDNNIVNYKKYGNKIVYWINNETMNDICSFLGYKSKIVKEKQPDRDDIHEDKFKIIETKEESNQEENDVPVYLL